MPSPSTIIVRYGEIALKGRNRPDFEEQLARNIRRALNIHRNQITRMWGQIIIRLPRPMTPADRAALQHVFGIMWFAEAQVCDPAPEAIEQTAMVVAADRLDQNVSFAIDAQRAHKEHPFTSQQLNERIGARLQALSGAAVNLDTPDVTVHISVRKNDAFVFSEKIAGPGGLPVGVGGRVLSLISGGFDSIAASYLMAKRGAQVDFLHFHVYPDSEGVFDSKMPRLWRQLYDYTHSRGIGLISYAPFQMAVLDLASHWQPYELVLFRRAMLRVAERVAERFGYQALVLGDSLGQVASQTLTNMTVVDRAVEIPIMRPVIGMDKVEVIDLLRAVNLRDLAAEPYKDCCSIIARSPITHADLAKTERIEASIDMPAIVEQMTGSMHIVELR